MPDTSSNTNFHGWNALLEIDQNLINALLAEQHRKYRLEGKQIPPLTTTIPIGNSVAKIEVIKLRLGVPKLSFAGVNQSAKATLIFPFDSGTVIELNDKGRVINYINITPTSGCQLAVNYLLQNENVVGRVDHDTVSIDFSREGWTIDSEQTNLLPNIGTNLETAFKKWLSTSDISYELTQLRSQPEQVTLQPTGFIPRIQKNPSKANESALATYIATAPNQGGDPPRSDSQAPYLISDETPIALQISEKTLLGILQNHFQEKHQIGSTLASEEGLGDYLRLNANDQLNSSDEITPVTWSKRDTNATEDQDFKLTGTQNITIKNQLIAQITDQGLSIHSNSSDIFESTLHILVTMWVMHGPQITIADRDISIKFKLSKVAVSHLKVRLSNHGTTISFEKDANENLVPEIDFADIHRQIPNVSRFVWTESKEALEGAITSLIHSFFSPLSNITFPEIHTLAVENLVLPLENKARIQEGNFSHGKHLSLQGTVEKPAHSVGPSEVILGASSKQQFWTTPTHSNTVWTVTPPEFGTIDSNGTLTVTHSLPEDGNFLVTATQNSKTSSALCKVTTEVSTLQYNDKENGMCIVQDSNASYSFRLESLIPIKAVQYTLVTPEGSSIGYGDLDVNTGAYASPAILPVGLHFLTVKATARAEDGNDYESTMPLLLQSADVQYSFPISPSFITEPLYPGDQVRFSAKKTSRFSPSAWEVYPPELGIINLSKNEDTFYALFTISNDPWLPNTLGFIIAYDPNNNDIKDQVGYAVFKVGPRVNEISLSSGISELSIQEKEAVIPLPSITRNNYATLFSHRTPSTMVPEVPESAYSL